MKKKQYQEPATMVVELQHKTQLLQASGEPEPVRGGSRINNWKDGGTTDEDIYM